MWMFFFPCHYFIKQLVNGSVCLFELSVFRGVARIFPEVRRVFQISPPSPYTIPNLTGRSTRIDVIILGLLRRQAWVKITSSRFIPSRLLSALSIPDSRFKRKPTFWCGGKESIVLKTDFRVSKKQTVRYFRKNTPKNQTELNAIEAIYIVVVVVLIFTLCF